MCCVVFKHILHVGASALPSHNPLSPECASLLSSFKAQVGCYLLCYNSTTPFSQVIWVVLPALSSGTLFLGLIQHLSQFALDRLRFLLFPLT